MARGLTVVGRTLGGSMCASLRQELPQGANFAQRLMPLALGTSSARSFMNQHFDLPLSRGFAGNLDSFGSRCYSTKVEDDTHDDFKPVSHAEGSSDVKSGPHGTEGYAILETSKPTRNLADRRERYSTTRSSEFTPRRPPIEMKAWKQQNSIRVFKPGAPLYDLCGGSWSVRALAWVCLWIERKQRNVLQ
eukprot:1175446-Prorocentrum_minimum.AAC.4